MSINYESENNLFSGLQNEEMSHDVEPKQSCEVGRDGCCDSGEECCKCEKEEKKVEKEYKKYRPEDVKEAAVEFWR